MTTTETGPARAIADGTDPPPVRELTVLYDAGCPICRAARNWLSRQHQLVPLRFVAAGSPEAQHRYPELDHAATLRVITVVADTGQIWIGDGAWLTCLWALTAYRGLAHRLATPRLRPLASQVVSAAARLRQWQYRDHDDRTACTDQCQR